MGRVNRSDKKERAYRPSLLVVLGLMLILAMLAQLTFLSMFGTKGKEVVEVRKEQKALILENELLEAEINKVQSLSRIREAAASELGMIDAGEMQYISLHSSVSSVEDFDER